MLLSLQHDAASNGFAIKGKDHFNKLSESFPLLEVFTVDVVGSSGLERAIV